MPYIPHEISKDGVNDRDNSPEYEGQRAVKGWTRARERKVGAKMA